MQGWRNERSNSSNELHGYWNIRDELSVHQGLIRPTKMRKEILIKINAGHQGREKYIINHQKEPLKPYPVPIRPYQVVGTDLCEINKKEYLVIVDAYSR